MLSSSAKNIVKKSQEFLTSMIKCIEFGGRQGIKTIYKVYLISASMLVIKFLKSIWQRIQIMHNTFPKQHKMKSYTMLKINFLMKLSKISTNNQLVEFSVLKLMKSQT